MQTAKSDRRKNKFPIASHYCEGSFFKNNNGCFLRTPTKTLRYIGVCLKPKWLTTCLYCTYSAQTLITLSEREREDYLM